MQKYLATLLLALFTSIIIYSQDKSNQISGNFENVPFEQFANTIENKTDYKFFYKAEWVKDVTIQLSVENEDVIIILDKILLANGLNYYLSGKRIIVGIRNYITGNLS